MTNEKDKEEIAKLIERQQDTTLKLQGCLLKNVRLNELYLYGVDLVGIALQIQHHCNRISVDN